MSSNEFLSYVTSIDQIEWMFKRFDLRYGKPGLKNPKKKSGQYAIRLIIEHLAFHKQSTCEEIAQKEFEKDIQTNRKLKSITDDIRKFIKNNLIWLRLVEEDGFKKLGNKNIKAYSLTPVGVLYAIHLFGNLELEYDFRTRENYNEVNLEMVRVLAKEYPHIFPKVFGKFENLEKIVGEEFEMTVIDSFSTLFSEPEPGNYDDSMMLTDFAKYNFWSSELTTTSPDPLIAEQFSLIFYVNLLSSIEHIFQSRAFYQWAKQKNQDKSIRKKQIEKAYQEANKIWFEILDSDKNLKKWYYDFFKMAFRSKRQEFEAMKLYRKKLSQKDAYLGVEFRISVK